MAEWRATEAKARFSAVLDKAETEGPQLVRRRKREFYVLTREQLDAQLEAQTAAAEKAARDDVSAWDALRPSFKARYDDVEFARGRGGVRAVELE